MTAIDMKWISEDVTNVFPEVRPMQADIFAAHLNCYGVPRSTTIHKSVNNSGLMKSYLHRLVSTLVTTHLQRNMTPAQWQACTNTINQTRLDKVVECIIDDVRDDTYTDDNCELSSAVWDDARPWMVTDEVQGWISDYLSPFDATLHYLYE